MYKFDDIVEIIEKSNDFELALNEFIDKHQNEELTQNEIEILNSLSSHFKSVHPVPIIAATDLQGNITYVNEEFLNISGYTRDEIIGQNIRILRAGDLPQGVYQGLWQTITNGKPWKGELWNRTKNYEDYWVSIFISPILDSNDKPVSYWSVAFDITERVKYQKEMERQKNDMLDSIKYAKRIQKTILPEKKALDALFEDHFVTHKPKDHVSGDFYWFNKTVEKTFLAVVDCTGHGVPGAFMSIIGYTILNQIVSQKGIHVPSLILAELHKQIRTLLKQDSIDTRSKDGMDVCLVCIHKYEDFFEYSGANRPLLILRHNKKELEEIKPTKFSIGGEQMEEERVYENHVIPYEPGDIIYLFSDGLVDQFGGPNMKKFSTKRLKELLISTYNENTNLTKQRANINLEWKDWMQDEEQTDDVTMLAVKL